MRRTSQELLDDLEANAQSLPSSFVGRETELSRLVNAAGRASVRLITITGPAGVGKTRLANEVVSRVQSRFPGGSIWISLAPLRESAEVYYSIARELQIDDEIERLPDRVIEVIGDRAILLVLDNLEHLAGIAPVIDDLLKHCPNLTVLCTSRSALGVGKELRFEIEPLQTPDIASADPLYILDFDAVRLFLDRARVTPHAAPINKSELVSVGMICARLDGLPLAIELVVPQLRVMRPRELLESLDQRLLKLRNTARGSDPRHLTMGAAIAWSYDLLPKAEQALFRRLSVCVGGFDRDMVRRLIEGRIEGSGYPFADGYSIPFRHARSLPYDPTLPPHNTQDPEASPALKPLNLNVHEALIELVQNNLIRRADVDDRQTRFEMLETIREFGHELISSSDEFRGVRHAHAAAMLAFAEASGEAHFNSGLAQFSREREDAELPNLRAALGWAQAQGAPAAELSHRLSGVLWTYWQSRGMMTEGRAWMEAAILHPLPEWSRAIHLPALGFLCWIQGADERAEEVLGKAVEVTKRLGFSSSEGSAHTFLALVDSRRGPAAVFDVLGHLDDAMAAYVPIDDLVGIGTCKIIYGVIFQMTGQFEEALAMFDEAAGLLKAPGYEWGIATATYFTGETRLRLGGDEDATRRQALTELEDALDRYQRMGDGWGVGGVVSAIASFAAGRGLEREAAQLFGAAAALHSRMGAFMPPVSLEVYDAAAADLERTMKPSEWQTARRTGGAMPLNAIVALAHEVATRLLDRPDPLIGLSSLQVTRVRQMVATYPKGEGFNLGDFCLKIGERYNTVNAMLTNIAKELELGSWKEILPWAIEHNITPAPLLPDQKVVDH